MIYTGGPAGNPVGADQLAAVVKVFANYPGIHLLTGDSSWPVTNWDPTTAGTVTASLLSQYPMIDGIISNYGTDALASAQAFQKAGRKLVPIATLDANGLSCLYKSKKVALESISSRNWLGRIAARKAIAAAEGLPNKRAEHLQPAVLRGHAGGQALPVQPEGRGGLLSLQQADARAAEDRTAAQREVDRRDFP